MDTERAEEPPNKVAKIEQQIPISVPNWLPEVLEWIKRTEMADSALSTSCSAFKELCWPKLHGRKAKPHFVEWMALCGKKDKSGILQVEMRAGNFPLPNATPPDYILGFKRIDICYLDARILDFFKCIVPKLNDVHFFISISEMERWGSKEKDKRTAMLDCLLNMLANKIGQFQINLMTNFGTFNQFFPGYIGQLDSLYIYLNGGIDVGFLYKWLTDRNENGGSNQKILEFVHYEKFLRDFFVRVEQEFTKATNPVNFLISFYGYCFIFDVDEFTWENEKTGEVLVAYQKQIEGHARLLLRCPKGEEERWKEEGEKKLKGNRRKDAMNINFDQ